MPLLPLDEARKNPPAPGAQTGSRAPRVVVATGISRPALSKQSSLRIIVSRHDGGKTPARVRRALGGALAGAGPVLRRRPRGRAAARPDPRSRRLRGELDGGRAGARAGAPRARAGAAGTRALGSA